MDKVCYTCNYNILCGLFDKDSAYEGVCSLCKAKYLVICINNARKVDLLAGVELGKCPILKRRRLTVGRALQRDVWCDECTAARKRDEKA